jgi:Kef-type K+ transport system membrane component KefB
MVDQPLTQVLLLLLASVGVVAVARRLGLPAILGYLFVGMLLGSSFKGRRARRSTQVQRSSLRLSAHIIRRSIEF